MWRLPTGCDTDARPLAGRLFILGHDYGQGLPAQLTGRVIHPDSPTYTKARTDWDGFYRSYPLVIVFAKTTEDVVNAITWSRQNDVEPRARSGRHSLACDRHPTGPTSARKPTASRSRRARPLAHRHQPGNLR